MRGTGEGTEVSLQQPMHAVEATTPKDNTRSGSWYEKRSPSNSM